MGGNDKALDEQAYCIRGLEPFQSVDVHEEFHSKRHFHQSTVLVESVRQNLLGIHDPDRFRILVATQSELSLRRAQQIAALDEHEVYNRVTCRRGSLLNTVPMSMPLTKTLVDGGGMGQQQGFSLSMSDRIRRLQEYNARRLTQIYSQPHKANGLFRFHIRRDSLFGGSTGGGLMRGSGGSDLTSPPGTRFQIRRDSLTPMSTTALRT